MVNRLVSTAAASFIITAGFATAGQISGHLTEGGKPKDGVKVIVTCGGSAKDAMTDRFGSYRLFQPANGECSLRVMLANQPAAPVVSYSDPVTFDFELVPAGGGSYSLRRR
jgi:hypothetical protein